MKAAVLRFPARCCCSIYKNGLVSNGHKRRQSSENFGEFQAGKINLVVIGGSRVKALSRDETNQRKVEEGEKMVEGRPRRRGGTGSFWRRLEHA